MIIIRIIIVPLGTSMATWWENESWRKEFENVGENSIGFHHGDFVGENSPTYQIGDPESARHLVGNYESNTTSVHRGHEANSPNVRYNTLHVQEAYHEV